MSFMSTTLFLGILVGLWGSLSFAEQVITVRGTGQVSSAPDKLRFKATVTTESKPNEVAKGIEANNRKMKGIFKKLQQLGVKKVDMQTFNFSVDPLRNYSGQQRILYAYSITNTLSVSIRKMGKVGAILAEVGNSGAQISSFNFEVDDPASLLSVARTKAMKNARKKAKEYAKAGDFKISRYPLVVNEIGGGYYSPPTLASSTGKALSSSRSRPDVVTALGQITHSVNIAVSYKILSR